MLNFIVLKCSGIISFNSLDSDQTEGSQQQLSETYEESIGTLDDEEWEQQTELEESNLPPETRDTLAFNTPDTRRFETQDTLPLDTIDTLALNEEQETVLNPLVSDSQIAQILLEKENPLGFTDEIVHKDNFFDDLPQAMSQKENQKECSTEVQNNHKVTHKGITLKQNQVLRSSIVFNENQAGLLKQTESGKVSNLSIGKLSNEQQALVALKQANMMLL